MTAFRNEPEYIKLRQFVGIDRWHNAGYFGQGLRIFCDDIGGSHVDHVTGILEVILPEAEIFTGKIRYIIQNGSVILSSVRCNTTGEEMGLDDFIRKYEIRLINNSTTGTLGPIMNPVGAYMRHKIDQYNLIMTASAGNGYGEPINTNYYGAAILVTSVKLDEGVKITSAKCAEGDGIDFSMFYGPMPGTSFSAPFLLGMIGLLIQRYPEMGQEEAYCYLKAHCLTLGKRKIFGWGLPVLGDPEEK